MISSLFSAGTSFVKLVADTQQQLPAITYWLMGSLSSIKDKDVVFLAIPVALGMIPLFFLRWRMNLLTVGEEESQSMGVNTRRLRQVRALADSGYTVLLSTHNPEHAFRFATHALVLQDGGVRAWGPVKETLTEELLRDMYRIPLTVADIPLAGGPAKGCVYGE